MQNIIGFFVELILCAPCVLCFIQLNIKEMTLRIIDLSGIADSKSTGTVHVANSLACPQSLSISGEPGVLSVPH